MSIELYSAVGLDDSYKLLQLTPDLVKILKEGSDNVLQFKSLSGDDKAEVVLCSRDKTWLVKQKNHSNTVLLMRGEEAEANKLVAFARTTFEYETRASHGELNLESIPIYDGDEVFPRDRSKIKIKNMDELLENSACSELECETQWHTLGGCEVNGCLCLLSSGFLSKALHVTLMSVMAENLNSDSLALAETSQAVSKDMDGSFNPYTREVVKTVLNRFGTLQEGSWRLNHAEIAQWYGIQALKKYVSQRSMALDEFLIRWKALFPPFFPCELDIDMLRGWHLKRGDGEAVQVQYVSRATLPPGARDRFAALFQLQSEWLLEDIAPFVSELNHRGLKLESFITKYARRRRAGNGRVIVSGR